MTQSVTQGVSTPSVGAKSRRLPIGAEVLPDGHVHFGAWAPRRRQVAVVLELPLGSSSTIHLSAEGNGYFSGYSAEARAGLRYRFQLDGNEQYPDPASRFQPEGPHGPSQIVDPGHFPWTDHNWRGIELAGQVMYEMHIGTFTQEGSWASAMRELPALAELGITALEVMPVAEFPGHFGWGYDGVNLFAPTRNYGEPDDFRRFVDRAHALGMGVLLDVVYNHLGPDGNYLAQFSPDYLTKRYKTDWGEAINFDGDNCGPVREFYVANAGYWIDEYHLDGLRLDATQNVYDSSANHILAAISRRVRESAKGRSTIVVAENEPQEVRIVQPPEQGGLGLDGLWNDDFHHSARVALTGRNEAYYTDFQGTPQELVSAVKRGYLYQGQYYSWQNQRRGSPTVGIPPARFVNYIQNHDQISNVARGERIHQLTSPGRYRAITALLLLGPATPLLFQGQEFAASSPFYFFADHKPELAKLVARGRREFLQQFPSVRDPEMLSRLPLPHDPKAFANCKLDLAERERHPEALSLHRDLLRLRREDPVFRAQRSGGVDGAVLGERAFVLRFFGNDDGDRLLIINLGRDLDLMPAPEPLIAPLVGKDWQILWSSEQPRYGGNGVLALDPAGKWRLSGESALVLTSEAAGHG
jgi:maltooligosyltrehalose trehalohydrolase